MDDAVELLRSIDKPLAVLSICGPYRSGKSYFISRALGSPGAFKLGHSMQACTRGIWMATTVLECYDFATVLLDTEGIDAVGASETMAMSLLTLTTLLSSFLIYNSKKVPQKVDLDKMRCFSQLSASLLAQCGESMSNEAKKAFFPHFLWLLRDVQLKMTDREGKELGPTEFIRTRILTSESGELTDLGKSLISLFPSLECATLSPPSINPKVLRDICKHPEKLSMKFSTGISALIQQILQKVSPKKGVDGTAIVNGKALAALAGGYVEAVNRPGALPDLDQGWQAVVRLELKEASYRLVREYERVMEEALEGNLPMEESNLLRIHRQTLKGKKSDLREEICRVNPVHSSDEDTQPLLDLLEQDIVQWNEASNNGDRKVTGGVLYQFTERNFSASKEHCEDLLFRLLKESKVQQKVQDALSNSRPIDIQVEASEVTEEYYRRAIGPAASEVMEKGMADLSKFSDSLKKIPGHPQNVEVIGLSSDRVKLSWDPPSHNPEAVEEYVVYKRAAKGGDWEEAARTKKTRALVKGLKSSMKYELHVTATNSLITSLASNMETETEMSIPVTAAVCSAATCLAMPLTIEILTRDSFRDLSNSGMFLRLGLCAAVLPVTVALSPIIAPVTVAAVTVVLTAGKHLDSDLSDE